ncbi:MAG TPA: hypothetical protein VLJ37_03075 [bacterium]|nr:hypothetical protein [bacterium]
MWTTALQFVLSAFATIVAARWLARSADRLAKTYGLSHVFVGSLFLAAATSSPELFVDLEATSKGNADLASGDLLGSSLVNLAIFAVLSLFIPGEERMPPARPVRGLTFLAALLTAQVGAYIALRLPGQVAGLHWGSVLLGVTYLAGIRILFRGGTLKEAGQGPVGRRRAGAAFLGLASGATVLFVAAPYLVRSVERIGIATGLGNTFMGTTLMAFTTSLPELASSVAALRLGTAAMAAGNLVGSNAFNMLIFSAMDALWTGGDLWEQIPRRHAVTAGVVILNLTVFCVLMMRTRAGRRQRIAAAIVILALTMLSYGVLYRLRSL